MAFGKRKEVPIQVVVDSREFQQIQQHAATIRNEVLAAVEELASARKALKKEREALAREIDRLKAARRSK